LIDEGKAMGFSLESASAWLMNMQQAFGSEPVTYSQPGQPDVEDVPAVIGDNANELLDSSEMTLVRSIGLPFVFKRSELNRTPKQGDVITRSDGRRYRVLPLGDDEQPYRDRGEMLRVFTRQIT
jgi:hypothetical protein